MLSSYYVIGLDGGGTKTESVLLGSDGGIYGTGEGGSVNPVFAGREVAEQSVMDSLGGVLEDLPSIDLLAAVGTCLHHGASEVGRMLSDRGYSGQFYLFSETDVAFRRAEAIGRAGVAVIAGTGSGFRYFDGRCERIKLGGWGAGVGDEGSAFEIGLNAIKAAGRAHDGRGPQTLLLPRFLDNLGYQHFWRLLARYCWPSLRQRDIAGLAKIVSEAAEDGDEVARGILADAGRSLGGDAVAMARRVFGPEDEFVIAYSGGVFSAGALVTDSLEELVRVEFPKAEFRLPRMSAGTAVARLTLERFLS
jgi:N-acetylglucosamine kinase-like BadF-type ATPase